MSTAILASPKRCAVYCRVSSDERFDQSFNSIDAQKEAGHAFITSQTHEGWIAVAVATDGRGLPLLRQLAAVWPSLFPAEQRRLTQLLIERVQIGDDGLEIRKRGVRKVVIRPDGESAGSTSRNQFDSPMLVALARAFYWQQLLDDGVVASGTDIEQRRVGRRVRCLKPDHLTQRRASLSSSKSCCSRSGEPMKPKRV